MRKSFTTTIEESIQQDFKQSCASNDIGMNDVLEALMKFYIDGKLKIERKVEYSVNHLND